MATIKSTDENFENLIKENKICITDFWATWCSPCVAISPILEELASELKDKGVVIAKQNRGLGKSFTIRRTVQGIGVEQVFLLNSPKILSITKKQSSKVRRAKLYFLRGLTGKATRLKRKFQS